MRARLPLDKIKSPHNSVFAPVFVTDISSGRRHLSPSSSFSTPTAISTIGFAAIPLIDVLPICSIDALTSPIASRIRVASSVNNCSHCSECGSSLTVLLGKSSIKIQIERIDDIFFIYNQSAFFTHKMRVKSCASSVRREYRCCR